MLKVLLELPNDFFAPSMEPHILPVSFASSRTTLRRSLGVLLVEPIH
ncbi:hypothetical protein MYK68_10030 [Gordonia sp. PP30]|nr:MULTISPECIES: hypothetical protein [unclassified Gordonia (in: high G+C Gram-positive bacteria)]UQE76863.1 hypothetical protein MYK68_10030 [Gordonia sp. PP30]